MSAQNLKLHPVTRVDLRDTVHSIFVKEAAAIEQFALHGLDSVCAAVELIDSRRGSLIVSGVGKSGHIGRKIASTFRSLGRHAVFMHAAEGSHGDLGLVDPNGVVLALSNSGETAELADLLAYCNAHEIPVIAITARHDNTLARAATVVIAYGEQAEVCINGLAPTTSTTLALAIGDALAVGFSHVAGVTADDFKRYHPGGKLGARLKKVRDVMHVGNSLPFVESHLPLVDILLTIAEKSLGCAIITENGKTTGIITDGDIRRHAAEIHQLTAADIASPHPVTVDPDTTLETAALEMSQAKVSVAVVQNKLGKTIGLLHIHQCVID